MDSAILVEQVHREAERKQCGRVVVAYSGGLDSTVLLHMLTGSAKIPVEAVFVEHGLQGDQPDWRARVTENCRRWSVPLHILALDMQPAAGQSVEALARDARYDALAGLPGRMLCVLAQHQDDQAETLLLQLLRGSGPAGLAGMPRQFERNGHVFYRPLLDWPASDLSAYATRHQLSWFDDPSNLDLRFDRNYLRQSVLPALAERWPSAKATLARGARWQAESLALQEQLAASDLRRVGFNANRLSVERLRCLPAIRQSNLMRFVLRLNGLPSPPSKRMQSVLALIDAVSGRGEVAWQQVRVRRYRDGLYVMRDRMSLPEDVFNQRVTPDVWLMLPVDIGRYRVTGVGLDSVSLRCALREGGERVKAREAGFSVSLARWFQDNDVPPWERQRCPILFIDDELAAVGNQLMPRFQRQWPTLQIEWQRGVFPGPRLAE